LKMRSQRSQRGKDDKEEKRRVATVILRLLPKDLAADS
jgi:hypothetical protein